MVTRQDITVCLFFLVAIMILMNLYTLLIFWKSKFDDRLILLHNNRKAESTLYKEGPIRVDSENTEVSSVRFRVIAKGGRYGLIVPRELAGTDYWKSLEAEILSNLESDESLALISSNKLEHVDRRLRRAFGFAPGNWTIRSAGAETLVPGEVWKVIDKWPDNESLLKDGSFGEVLHFLRTVPVKQVSGSRRGTQLKLELLLDGGKLALFKPAWYKRDALIRGDPYGGKDRHFGEIAAFYLAQLLGYRTGPLVVGRKLTLVKEVLPFSTIQLNSTFYENANGDLCFYGVCYYCKKSDPICSTGGAIEGALVLLMRQKLKQYPNPWRRTYVKNQFADWERNASFCHSILPEVPKSHREKLVLEIVAITVFDFLIGNADRHHLDLFVHETIKSGHLQNIALIDNGKSFGDPEEDYYDILAPLYQCCVIREGLYKTLNKFRGDLGRAFAALTALDPLHPLLTPSHLSALDRRLKIVLATIKYCQTRRSKVIL